MRPSTAYKKNCRNYKDLASLDLNGQIIAEYAWIDGSGINLRSKSRTFTKKIESLSDLPEWNYDGSSCYQAQTEMSEIILKPVAMFKDPFRRGDHLLVLCDSYAWADKSFTALKPANTNFRYYAQDIFSSAKDKKLLFGIKQELTLLQEKNQFKTQPYGFPRMGFPAKSQAYHGSVGANRCFGRDVLEAFLRLCLYAGVKVGGYTSGSMPGQWEFQVGPCEGTDIGDHLWMARYILGRVAEDYQLVHSFDPKPLRDCLSTSSTICFSDQKMRTGEGGMKHLEDTKISLAGVKDKTHRLHVSMYSSSNPLSTQAVQKPTTKETLTYGIGDRSAQIGISSQVAESNGKGYMEDRRPAGDANPYVVCALIASAQDDHPKLRDPLENHFRKWQEERGEDMEAIQKFVDG